MMKITKIDKDSYFDDKSGLFINKENGVWNVKRGRTTVLGSSSSKKIAIGNLSTHSPTDALNYFMNIM